jgi:hypothetical protein
MIPAIQVAKVGGGSSIPGRYFFFEGATSMSFGVMVFNVLVPQAVPRRPVWDQQIDRNVTSRIFAGRRLSACHDAAVIEIESVPCTSIHPRLPVIIRTRACVVV